jgi:hypothetical protein
MKNIESLNVFIKNGRLAPSSIKGIYDNYTIVRGGDLLISRYGIVERDAETGTLHIYKKLASDDSPFCVSVLIDKEGTALVSTSFESEFSEREDKYISLFSRKESLTDFTGVLRVAIQRDTFEVFVQLCSMELWNFCVENKITWIADLEYAKFFSQTISEESTLITDGEYEVEDNDVYRLKIMHPSFVYYEETLVRYFSWNYGNRVKDKYLMVNDPENWIKDHDMSILKTGNRFSEYKYRMAKNKKMWARK